MYVIEKTDGEIAYFYENGSIGFCSLAGAWQTTLGYTSAGKYPLSADGKALSVSSISAQSGVVLNNPIVSDISGYNYFYVDVYNPQDENVKFYINYIWNNNYLEIAPKTWTRVVVKKNDSGNFEMLKVSGKISGPENDNKTIFDSNPSNAQPTNLKGLMLGLEDAANKTIYFGSFRAVNELPELPDGIVYATAPKVKLSSANYAIKGSSQKVEFAIEDGEDAELSVKVSINGGSAVAVENLDEFTFSEAGEYKFITVLTKNGKEIFSGESLVYSIAPKGNEVLFTGNAYGKQINGIRDWLSGTTTFDSSVQVPGESSAGALKVTSNGLVTESGILNGFDLAKPSIANVGEYKYVYFDVYNPQNRDIDFAVNFVWGYPVAKLYANHWTRIVLEVKSDGIYLRDAYTDQIGGTNKNTAINGFNFTNVAFFGLAMEANEYFLMGNVYAVNELPELPAGVKYNWNPVVEFSVGDLVVQGSTAAVNATVTNNDNNLAYELKVSVNGGEATSITAGSEYTFANAGEYKFSCVFTKDGNVVYTAEHTVFAVAAAGNEVLFTGNEYGKQINKFVDWYGGTVSYDNSVTVPGESAAGALKLTCKEASAVGEGFYASVASIANVGEYGYVYFDVFNAQNRDIDFSVMYAWNYPVVKLYANHWTRIVLEVKSDGIYLRDAYTDQNGGTNKKTDISGYNFTNVGFFAMGMNATEYLYMGNVYAVNELPELPAGVKYNWNPVVEFSVGEIVVQGSTATVNATVTNNDDNLAYELKVSVNGGEATTITAGSEYTFANAGEYKFTCVFTKDGNVVYTAEHTVFAVAAKGNEVLFTGNEYGKKINGIRDWLSGMATFDSSAQVPGESSAGALKVTSNGVVTASGILNGFDLTKPSIANVGEYKYVYFDVYNPQNRDIDFTVNFSWGYPVVKLYANHWTRIVLEVKSDGIYLRDAYTDQQGGTNKNTAIKDFNFTNVAFVGLAMEANEYFLMGNVYAVNELPELPADVKYNWNTVVDCNPVVEFSVGELVVQGSTAAVNVTVTNNDDNLAYELKVSVNGGEATTITAGSEYTFANAGEYKFSCVFTKDGNVVYTAEHTVFAVAAAGKEVLFTGNENGNQINKFVDWYGGTVSYDNSVTVPGASAAGVLKLTCKEASPVGEGFFASVASIANVGEYKYVYFDVFNAQNRDIDFSVRYAYNYPVVKLYANHWTRIVLEVKSDGIYLRDAYTDQNGGTNKKTDIKDFNFTNVEFFAMGMNATEYLYMGNVYAVNELPELPAGVKYNWNPVVEFSVGEIVVHGSTATVNATVTNNDDLAYELKVSVNGGEATTITAGSEYTFANAGEYKFTCVFTKDGNVVYTAEHTVFAVAAKGNEVLFTGNEYGKKINGIRNWLCGTATFDSSAQVPGESLAGALKVTSSGYVTESGILNGFDLTKPSIANVGEYKYVYFDVYNPQNRDIDFTVGFVWGYPVVKLYANHWTRIVLEVKDDGIYLRDAYTDQVGGTNKKTGIAGFNFTNVQFIGLAMEANEYFLMGNVYAVNELPELPAGVKYNWTTKANMEVSGQAELDGTVTVSVVTENAEGATLTLTVSKDGGEPVVIENNSEYKFESAGTYVFTAVVTLDGEELARATKTIVIINTESETPVVAGVKVLALGEADGITTNGVTAWNNGLNNARAVEYDSTIANPAESKTGALKVTSNGGELTAFVASAPSVADVRSASYLYMDIYNPQSRDLDFTISYEWAYPLVKLRANSWTRIVLEVGREAGRYEVGGDNKISNLYFIHAYSSQQGDLKQKISVYDGSFINEEFVIFNMAADEYVCVGNLYAVNKLPELPAGVSYPVCARTEINVDDFVTVGHKQVVNLTPVDAAGATLSVTLSVNGGEATAFTSGTEYTFATAGVYKFTCTLTNGETTVATNVRTIRVLESENGTKLISLGSESEITASNVAGWQSATVSYSTEKNAMQLTATGGAVEGFNCGGFTATATITDVRGYKYVYFDVYNPLDRDLDVLVGYAWGYPLVKLKANSWTRVVITCGGHLLMNDAYSSQQGLVKTKVGIDDGNFTNQGFVIKGLASGESVYVSSVYVTGELPELPAGYVCGYKG